MVETAESVEWTIVRNEVEALMLEYSLIKQHRPALQRAAARRQELPVPCGHRRRAVAAGAGDAGPQTQGHPLLRTVCPRLRDPRHPRPLVEVVPDPHVQPGQVQPARAPRAGRACCSTSRSAPGRASARSRRCRTAKLVNELCDFLDGDTDEIVDRLEADMQPTRQPTSNSSAPPASATACPQCARRSRSNRWSPSAARTST